jgi:photosystem II stability/assembly factor-like uncharacterized protein
MRAILYLFAVAALGQSWVEQKSGTTASFRGVSAASATVVWASGTAGTFVRTIDGGNNWLPGKVQGAETLDFRDVQAVDSRTAYLLSIGEGEKSRIYKTTDAGASWTLQLTNPDAKGFFDQMAFWDPMHGILVGDQVDGQMVVMTTADGGKNWQKRRTLPAIPGEGAFAASGTGIVVHGKRDVWFGTGGKGAARVFYSNDGGENWSVVSTPLRNDAPSAGIFSLAFSDGKHGIAAGGDYSKAADEQQNIAITSDGGRSWINPSGTAPKGFRSAVAFLKDKKMWIAAGPSGSDISVDGGKNWRQFDSGNYNAISFVSSRAGWAVGPRGRIARFRLD